MSAAIDEAVMATLQGDATLASLAPGGVYRDVAPENVPDPFVILQLQAHQDIYALAGVTAFEAPLYLVKAVGKNSDGAGAAAAAARIHALLQGQPLAVAGFSVMDVRRTERVTYTERDGPVFWQHHGGLYQVEAHP
ncbi:MAG: DUF3168 domain-containing protein [Vicinamibacterales bacterium]